MRSAVDVSWLTGISKNSPAFAVGEKKETSSTRLIPKYFSIEERSRGLPIKLIASSSLFVNPRAMTSAATIWSRSGATE